MKLLKINGIEIESVIVENDSSLKSGVYYSAKKLYEAIGKVENLRISRYLDSKDFFENFTDKYSLYYYRTNKITYMFHKNLFIKYASWINKELGRLVEQCIQSEDCTEVNYEINKPIIKKDVKEVETDRQEQTVNNVKPYVATITDRETPDEISTENDKGIVVKSNNKPQDFEQMMVQMIGKSVDNNEFDFAKQLFSYMTSKLGFVPQDVSQQSLSLDDENHIHEVMTNAIMSLSVRKFDLDKLKRIEDKEKFKLIRQFIKESTVDGNDFQKMMEVYNTSDIAKSNNVEVKDLFAMLSKLGVVKRASNCGSWVFIEPKKYEKLATVYKSLHQDTNKVRSYTIKWNGCGKIFVEKFIELFFSDLK